MDRQDHQELMTALDMERVLNRLADQILEQISDHEHLALIGIQRRGVDLAGRIGRMLSARIGRDVPCGELDINLYRDDWTTIASTPQISATHIDFSVEGKILILIDDVLFTGRTVRCALEAIVDFGRPKVVKLLVLIDRGHRELPIQADFIGQTVPTSRSDQVNVFLLERDERDQVVLN